MSGHSKWAQIKHKKATTDARKGQLFSKLVREIIVAVRHGGENPDFNSRLRVALTRARAEGLPKENIARAIARAKGEGGEAGVLQEFLYEATAPGGVLILIEGITDNKNRTFAEVKKILAERGARLADQGSILWNFEKVGLVEIRKEDNQGREEEEIESTIVESGAEDFHQDDTVWTVETKFQELDSVRGAIEKRGIRVYTASLAFRPRTPLSLEEKIHASVEPLLNALVDHDDVQEVYTNLKND